MNMTEREKVQELIDLWEGEATWWRARANELGAERPAEALEIQRRVGGFAGIYDAHANALKALL